MTWRQCVYLIRSDLYRVRGKVDPNSFLRTFATNPPTRMLVIFRIGVWARAKPGVGRSAAKVVTSVLHRHMSVRYSLEIPFATEVGPGLKIIHRVGGIVLSPTAMIGSGVTLSPGVVVGAGSPTLCDGVAVSVGAKVLGSVTVGAGSRIGANAVVTSDIPAGVVAVGVPARPLEGSKPKLTKHNDFHSAIRTGER